MHSTDNWEITDIVGPSSPTKIPHNPIIETQEIPTCIARGHYPQKHGLRIVEDFFHSKNHTAQAMDVPYHQLCQIW